MKGDKIGKLLLVVLGAGMVLVSAYGLIYSILNVYLNHVIVWVGIAATGLMLALSTALLFALYDWLKKCRTGTTSSTSEVEE